MASDISTDQLKVLCELTADLVKIKQSECKHLCVENAAADVLHLLLRVWFNRFNPNERHQW